jgi:5-deoxy-D-glucuronate isomerase
MRSAGDPHLPAGSAAADGDPVVVTPKRAGWRYCGQRVLRLAPGERRERPGWSSHPPHKHDDASLGAEAELEEIYDFRTQGDGGFGLHRTYDPVEGWDVSAAVETDDVFLVPRGYHGPCAASPEHAMWYLNVLAGPGDVRSMAISDDPAHAWVRGSWPEQVPDPRVPMIRPATIRG